MGGGVDEALTTLKPMCTPSPDDDFRLPKMAARQSGTTRQLDFAMLHYAVVFFVIAIIAAVLGFSGIAGAASNIAWILFVVFLILAVISLFRKKA